MILRPEWTTTYFSTRGNILSPRIEVTIFSIYIGGLNNTHIHMCNTITKCFRDPREGKLLFVYEVANCYLGVGIYTYLYKVTLCCLVRI